jgi:hypothetical protein
MKELPLKAEKLELDYRHITKELDLAAKESVTDFRAIIEEKNEDLELQKIFGREKYSIFAKIQRTILYALASSLIEARTYEGFDPNFVLDETKKYLSLFLENEEINETFDDELQLQVVKMTFARKIESLVKAITDFDIEVNAGL